MNRNREGAEGNMIPSNSEVDCSVKNRDERSLGGSVVCVMTSLRECADSFFFIGTKKKELKNY